MGQVRGDTQILSKLLRDAEHVSHTLERRVTVLLDQRAVRFGKSRQVRRVDDQLAALFDDRAELVTRLSTHPQLVVMRIEQGNYTLILPPGVANMNPAAHLRCASKRFADVAGKKRVRHQLFVVNS